MSGWNSVQRIGRHQFRCGYCGYNIASDTGLSNNNPTQKIWVCPNCDGPSFFGPGVQIPGIAPGQEVENVPDNLTKLYGEARRCCSVNAFTASVLASRKMLMNIAVEQGAKEGLKFIEYVNHLAEDGYIPPNGKGWVDHIRKKGNEATHEIALMGKGDAEELILFSEMLLKFIYEFPARVPKN